MKKLCAPVLLTAIAASMVACSGHGMKSQPPLPSLGGPWEFKAVSSSDSTHFTGLEVALKAGQTLENGVETPNGQVSATGATQIAIITVDAANGSVVFGGNCPPSGDGSYSLSGSFSAQGGPINFTYTENGNTFNVTATLAGDDQSLIGTYTSASGSDCSDSGNITGAVVPKLSGVYVGNLTLPDGTTASVTATFSEDSSSTLTLNLLAATPESTNFTMNGPVTGAAFLVQGTFQGNPVTYEGYYELNQALAPSIYFVNATNSVQPAYAGTLTPQPPQN